MKAHPHTDVAIRAGRVTLAGDFVLPQQARGMVLFAHGSGSSRHSPRNQFVAQHLNAAGFGTLLLDLLTSTEETADAATAAWRFDIRLLADRLQCASVWLAGELGGQLPVGYFGSSTGAAAALVAAAEQPAAVQAIVSRGGRPDLASEALRRVQAPTLLIVGGADLPVLVMNESARRRMPGPTRVEVIAGAGHLFEEPGALEQVARLAADWFGQHLRAAPGTHQENDMSTGLAVFDTTVQKTHTWLKEIRAELHWHDQHRAYQALRAVLQTLRDRLTIEEAAQLGAQLPMLVRGFYYEGWRPSALPRRELRQRWTFLAEIRRHFNPTEEIDPEQVTQAVLRVLSRHVTAGEIEDVRHLLPADLRSLWEDAA